TAAGSWHRIVPANRNDQVEQSFTASRGLRGIGFEDQLIVERAIAVFHPAIVFRLRQKWKFDVAQFITEYGRIIEPVAQRITASRGPAIAFALQLRVNQAVASDGAFDRPVADRQ